MFNWYKKVVLENYANFSGRARRSEYWYFVLTNTLIFLVLYGIGVGLVLNQSFMVGGVFSAVALLYMLATLVPSLAVAVRRLHDVDKSGWYYFVGLIPLVGGIIMLIWFCTEGTTGANNYGADPKNNGLNIQEIGVE